MSPTQIEEETTVPLVFDSGASAHYYLTAFDKESPNDGGSQEYRIIIANGVELSKALLLVGTLVQQQEYPADLLTRHVNRNGRLTQTYARTTGHVRPEQPSLEQLRLSVAGNRTTRRRQ